MRDIKFRAWNKNLKEMFEVGQITLEEGIWDYQPKNKKHIGVSIPYQPSFILMQYTGLKDDNEKEIYEGDILHIDAYTYTNPAFSGEYLVQYNEELGMWRLIDLENYKKDKEDFMIFEDLKGWYRLDIAVIGNIYDNPELLKED